MKVTLDNLVVWLSDSYMWITFGTLPSLFPIICHHLLLNKPLLFFSVSLVKRYSLSVYLRYDFANAEHCYPEVRLGHLKRYTFKELRTATDHFSSKRILGKGGFGVVYKACLNNGTVVAVKRLNDYNAVGGENQFQTEVELISLAVHRNLLHLLGFCSTESERLLVYPFMPNGSVASRLKGQLLSPCMCCCY